MPYSEAQKRADKKYRAKAYDQLSIRIPKGKREEYKRLAEKRGESLAGMIIRLLESEMQKDGRPEDGRPIFPENPED